MDFQLKRMSKVSKSEIINDIRRVDGLVNRDILTSNEYHKHSMVSHGTLLKYFGSWHNALCESGLEYKSNRRTKTEKLSEQQSKFMTDEEVLEELKIVANKLNKKTITVEELDKHSRKISGSTIRNRFGWKEGLKRAGLKVNPLGKRYSDGECYENLLNVWTHYGRQPTASEMSRLPSIVGSGAYILRWGGWLKTLEAFVEEVNREPDGSEDESEDEVVLLSEKNVQSTRKPKQKKEDQRAIGYRLRYKVLNRDNFKCVICGNRQSDDPKSKLHVDHIVPFSKGGKTVFSNLRTLCYKCNIGKGDLIEKHTGCPPCEI